LKAYEAEENKKKLQEKLYGLRAEVRELENTITNTKTTRGFTCLGTGLLAFGGIMSFLGMILLSLDDTQSWGLIVGLTCVVLAFVIGKDSKEMVEANCKKVDDARMKLPSAKERLANFQKEHPDIK
jgi:hypothetical protein